MDSKTSLIASLAAAALCSVLLLIVGAVSLGQERGKTTDSAGRAETALESTETVGGVVDTPEGVKTQEGGKAFTVGALETETESEVVRLRCDPDTVPVEIVTEPETEIEAVAAVTYSPLPPEHDAALREVCEASGVPYEIALALIWHESRFCADVVNPRSGCYGYCQLSPDYFPSGLSPEDNIRRGIGWLGELIAEYGDVGAALTVYACGEDDGSRTFAGEIFDIVRGWR